MLLLKLLIRHSGRALFMASVLISSSGKMDFTNRQSRWSLAKTPFMVRDNSEYEFRSTVLILNRGVNADRGRYRGRLCQRCHLRQRARWANYRRGARAPGPMDAEVNLDYSQPVEVSPHGASQPRVRRSTSGTTWNLDTGLLLAGFQFERSTAICLAFSKVPQGTSRAAPAFVKWVFTMSPRAAAKEAGISVNYDLSRP